MVVEVAVVAKVVEEEKEEVAAAARVSTTKISMVEEVKVEEAKEEVKAVVGKELNKPRATVVARVGSRRLHALCCPTRASSLQTHCDASTALATRRTVTSRPAGTSAGGL